MTTTNHVKGWIGVLMTEDFSFHWPTKPMTSNPKRPGARVLSSFVFFGHDGVIELAREYGRYGYRRVTALLRVRGLADEPKACATDLLGAVSLLRHSHLPPLQYGRMPLQDGHCHGGLARVMSIGTDNHAASES